MAVGDSFRSISTFDHSEADYELSSDKEMHLGISSSLLVSATSDGNNIMFEFIKESIQSVFLGVLNQSRGRHLLIARHVVVIFV